MKTLFVGRGLLAVAFFAAWGATGANALVFRAYLSSTGNDANPCTLPAPCRLLPAALTAVQSGGEIWMLDSANYNTSTVTIAKSVTILAVPGALGSVVATGGPAISIASGGLVVALRNLVIVPLPSAGGTDGVSMSGASTLTMEDSLIANLPSTGVMVVGTGNATIVNSIIRNNGFAGVRAQDGAQAVIAASFVIGNGYGVLAYSQGSTTTKATVSDTTFSGNSIALEAQGDTAGSDAQLLATRCTVTGNGDAVISNTFNASASSLVTLSANMITNNRQRHICVRHSGEGQVAGQQPPRGQRDGRRAYFHHSAQIASGGFGSQRGK